MKLYTISSGSKGNCYIITDSNSHQLIIECGVSIKDIIPHINFDTIDGCIVSHSHKDHSSAIADLKRYGVKVYTNEELIAGTLSIINNWIILPIPTAHSVPCYSFIIHNIKDHKQLLFVTDTREINNNIADQPFDLAMIEANYSEKYIQEHFAELDNKGYENHLSVESVVEWLNSRQNKPKHICLIHLSGSGKITEIDAKNALKSSGYDCIVAKSGEEVDW